MRSSKAFDSTALNQANFMAHRHSQLDAFNPVLWERPELSEHMTRAFTNNRISAAVTAALRGNNYQALWFLGQGLHAIADSTSPEHRKDGQRTRWPGMNTFRHGERGEGVDELTPELLDESKVLLRNYYNKFCCGLQQCA